MFINMCVFIALLIKISIPKMCAEKIKMITILDDKTYAKAIKADVPVIVDFFASWCGPCQMLGPVFEDISNDKDFKGKLNFAKVSTEDHPEISADAGVQGIPCMIFFKNGREVQRIVGFAPKPVLKMKIMSVLEEI